MPRSRFARTLFAGPVAGALVLGAGGRLAMYASAVHAARAPHFSMGGSLGIVLIGAVLGTIGALLFGLATRRLAHVRVAHGAVFGLLFLAVVAPLQPPAIREEVDAFRGRLAFPLACFALAFAGYGAALGWRAGAAGVRMTATTRPPAA
jgi:hypothetical protein